MATSCPTQRLEDFFKGLNTLSLLGRLFRWKNFRALGHEAYGEFTVLKALAEQQVRDLDGMDRQVSSLKKDYEHLQENEQRLDRELSTSNTKVSQLDREKSELERQRSGLEKENIIFKRTEDDRRTHYENNVAGLNSIKDRIEAERQKEILDRKNQEIERLKALRETWGRHQANVEEVIKEICRRHTIEYVGKVPFKGTPDNTIKICDEYVIFDAKSPANDDLKNFPGYIKNQADAAKKYIKEENVRKEMFLVIPSTTVDVIEQFAFNMGDYRVWIVTLDAIEPIICALKRLEDYEFVNQLSPDERENICRVIGRFAHITKRRIQIDHFFDRESLEILLKCESDLPGDIFEKALEYERADKLNPPMERRTKAISSNALHNDSQQIMREAAAKDIAFPSSLRTDIQNLQLYAARDAEANDALPDGTAASIT